MTDAARREHESLKKKVQPKLSLSLMGSLSRNSVATPPRHNSGNLTPPVTPPITPSSSFRSSTPTGTSSGTRFMLIMFPRKMHFGNNSIKPAVLVWCSVIDNPIITLRVTHCFFHRCSFPWPSLEQQVLSLPQLNVLSILFVWVWNRH